MLFTISDTGHQRRTVAETFKIEGDFLGNSRVTMLLAKYRLVFGETTEETIEMNIKEVMSSEATTEMILEITGKIAGQGFRDLS
jgi:actin-like ATPase involved in cell morphogenesis